MPSLSKSIGRLAGPLSAALLLVSLLPGCPPESDDDDDDVVAPPGVSSCDEDSDCLFQSGLEICGEQGACVHGDRNNSMEDAQLVEDGDSTELYIAPAGDVDWFRFNGNQGDLIYIAATAEDSDVLDTLITYYDTEGNQIGWGDDFDRVSGVAPNSRYYSGVPATGVSFFSIQDKRSWANDPSNPPTGGAGHQYQLFFGRVGGASAATHASESNDDSSTAVPWLIEKYATNYNLGGGLEPVGDVDWIAVDVLQGEVLRLYGFPGSGSQGTTQVTAYLPDATTAIRSYQGLAWDADHRAWIPVLETGTYYLEVQDSNGGGGFDYWYFLHAAKDEVENGHPAEVEPNGSAADANVVSLAPADGESVATQTLWGRIGDAGDQDRFSFDTEAGDQLTVSFVRTAHGESTAVQMQLVNPAAMASECTATAPGDDDDSAGDDDDSAGDDDDSSSSGSDTLPACCSTSSCGSVTPAPIAWDGSDDPVLSLQELGAGTWNLSVSDVDSTAGGGGNYYELTLSLLRQ